MKSNLLANQGPGRVLIAAFVLAVVHHYLFYGNSYGVSVPLFVLMFYGYILAFIPGGSRNVTWFNWLLLAVIVLLSLTYVLFDNPLFRVLNGMAVPFLVAVHMALMLHKEHISWASLRLIKVSLSHLIPYNFRHWPTAFGIMKKSVGGTMESRHKAVAGKVFIGLTIALPIVLIVVHLLSSADGLFNHVLSGLPERLEQLSLGEAFIRGMWIVVFGLAFFGYLWGFVATKQHDQAEGWDGWDGVNAQGVSIRGVSFRLRLDAVIIATVLIAVNAVYILFVAVQFSYLFGAWDGVLPDGLSYAEYARSGFFELVTVTVINFILLIGTLVYSTAASKGLERLNHLLLYILVACSGIMLYSAFTRLQLYEEVYGYTYIRFLVHAFMIYLGVMMVIALIRIRYTSIPLAKCYIVISLAAYVIINYAGMDRVIAEQNIDRYRETGQIDHDYLLELSTDAIPLLADFSREEYTALQEGLHGKWRQLERVERKWPSFNMSSYRAEKVLKNQFHGE